MLAALLLWSQVLLTSQSLADLVPLLTVLDEDASSIPDCQEEGLESCEKVDVDFDAFFDESSLLFPGGIALDRGIRVNGTEGCFSYTYQAEGTGTTILTYTNSTGYEALDGSIHLGPDGYYVLENCGPDCHVLGKEGDVKTHPTDPYQNDTESSPPASRILGLELDRMLNLGREGGEAVFTVEFYYTPEFARITSNIQAFFNNEINQVNVGYQLTTIEVRAKIHCIKQIDLTEPNDSYQRILNFRNAISPLSGLYNSADIAVLYTGTTVPVPNRPYSIYCGRVWGVDSINYDNPPIAWIAKNCANTLAHEIGHMFAARHDRNKDNTDDIYTDAHGFRIEGGYHTIMAYSSTWYPTGIDYYSNNIHTYHGASMGDSQNNNRRILQLNRFAIASKGNERTSCTGVEFAGTVSSSCSNESSDDDCCYWVNKGYCVHTWDSWMSKNCARSCRYCCVDAVSPKGRPCSHWASLGYCTHTYVTFMNCNCARTCEFCP